MPKAPKLVLTNAPIALRMGAINKLAEEVKAPVILLMLLLTARPGELVFPIHGAFGGGVDFVLHSIV